MLHSQTLVVRCDCAAGNSLELWVALLRMRYQLQHVLHLIALCLLVLQGLHSTVQTI